MKQSHSVSYLRPKENEKSSLINSETPSPVKVQVKVKQTEDQSGNDWNWMWLNHIKREEQAISARNQKFEMHSNMILNNLSKFGSEYNNSNESK